ncbi:hypothetical protein M2163_000527 [Streptomyces sp. SAI-135]|nr:hypothetical protein [Streptomyces sp. SAI-090]MDH6554587.1 hypothetical protein [Streptomyces sp. SAI-041]MDH6613419.1 hypothetical protein [Streptomyces sp. SAI-135]
MADLGYENADDGFRHPGKKSAGGELTETQQTHNKVIRGIHGVCERANSLLFITKIAAATSMWGYAEAK